MIRSRLGLKALVLSGLVLGLMALDGGVAQAEVKAKWRVNGADVGALAPQLFIKEIENKSASLSFKTAGGTAVLVLCTAAEFAEGGKLIAEGGISLGRGLFKGCVVLLNEVAAPNCKPHSPGKGENSGEILSEKVKGLVVLDLGNDLVKFTPENASGVTARRLAIIELGALCSIGEVFNVETTELNEGLWIKDVGGNAGFLTDTVTHLAVEGLSKMIAFGSPATIIGSAVVELGGIHKGLTWSGVPG